jgi:hypothetical protein
MEMGVVMFYPKTAFICTALPTMLNLSVSNRPNFSEFYGKSWVGVYPILLNRPPLSCLKLVIFARAYRGCNKAPFQHSPYLDAQLELISILSPISSILSVLLTRNHELRKKSVICSHKNKFLSSHFLYIYR